MTHPLVDRALAGERLALSRLLTLIDDGAPGSAEAAAQVAARAGRALVVGITGVPGGGKSTLVNALIGVWLARGHKVAVIAIDPSSPVSGGAVLGDRIRMGDHGAHPDVFIRSFSARGVSGGLSRATRGAVDCFDAAGFDRVIVETVGTGQSETEIVSIADTRVVVCPPGLGDDVQAIKAGILEIADVFAISKSDLPLADATAKEMREMLTLRRAVAGAWKPAVLSVSASAGTGIEALVDAIESHAAHVGLSRRRPRPALPSEALPVDADGWRERLAEMGAHDGFFQLLGLTVLSAGAGRAEIGMTVEARHVNFNGGCHGGAIFTLADTAFGMAANSHGSLASGIATSITFEAGVREGSRLIARSRETKRTRQVGFYEVEVVRVADGREEPVARFSGTVFIKNEPYRLHRRPKKS